MKSQSLVPLASASEGQTNDFQSILVPFSKSWFFPPHQIIVPVATITVNVWIYPYMLCKVKSTYFYTKVRDQNYFQMWTPCMFMFSSFLGTSECLKNKRTRKVGTFSKYRKTINYFEWPSPICTDFGMGTKYEF